MVAASKPTSQLSENANSLWVALSRHLGTLTAGWALTLTGTKLTPGARLPASTAAASAGVLLRQVARGTSHSRPRLAFHPYAQVNRVICTSTSGRPSTSLSEGFSLPRHRSTGFGHRTQDSSRAHDAPRPLRGCGLVAFATASLFTRLTSPWIRTPRPVFQNGRHDVAPRPLGRFVASCLRPTSL